MIQVTVCSKNRRKLFANEAVHELCREVWQESLAWRVGEYVIMPDHIHLFCVPGQMPVPSLKGWVYYWKSVISRRWPGGPRSVAAGVTLWLKDFWDTQMRSRTHYDEKLSYVRQNPVRGGLVASPEQWPFQGRVFSIRW